ncbi:hypothetical protein ACHAWT_000307 [Skeletonema menzelii]
MAAITVATCKTSAATRYSCPYYWDNEIETVDTTGNSSSGRIMNGPRSSIAQNNDTANMVPDNSRNGHHRQAPLARSMLLPSKVSLIDNTLAVGYSLKRAHSCMKKSNSDGMIGAKRIKLPSYCPTTVIISSSNLTSSTSASSFSKVDPEENLCPYSFIDSLQNESSISREEGKNTEPLTDNDFAPPTPEQIEAYSNDALSAVRTSDVNSLRRLHSEGHSLECCNRFGESLLHVACRRSNAEIVSFLLNEAKVSPCIRDDYGRTPLHDACWRGNPEYEIVELLLSVEPRLAFVKDVRGHKPFQYARREHWSGWRKFIDQKRELILLPRSNSVGALRQRVVTSEQCQHNDM